MRDKIEKHSNLIIVLALGLFCLPMLAMAPQSGDGAEMIKVAAYGGKLHPPGFPGQSWLMRVFAAAFLGIFSNLDDISASSLGLSFFSLIGYLGAVWFLLKTFDLLKVSFFPKLFAVLAFAFYPAIWKLGVQPEVFAWCFLVMALMHYLSARAYVRESSESWMWILILIVGVWAYCVHPISITQYAAALASFILLFFVQQENKKVSYKFESKKFAKFLLMALAGYPLVLFLFYSTLFFKGGPLWPNWGDLENLDDLIKHGLRAEYGVMKLASSHGSFNGLNTFLVDLGKYWHVNILLMASGFWFLFGQFKSMKVKAKIFYMGLVGSFFLSILFLYISNLGGFEMNALPTLERFQGTVIVPATLFVGLGWQKVWSLKPQLQKIFVGIGIALSLFLLITVYPQAYLAKNNTTVIFSRALGVSLPENAFYIGLSDIETTLGATRPDGEIIFPLKFGLIPTGWYLEKVIRSTEKRIKVYKSDTMTDLIDRAYKRGLTVAAIDQTKFKDAKKISRLNGTFFVASPDIKTDKSWEIAATAIKMCDVIKDMNALPRSGHVFSRTMRNVIARTYLGAEFTFRDLGNQKAMAAAQKINNGIKESSDATTWRDGCEELKKYAK